MANYVSNHIFITGSKQAVVDFLNKGLKGNKAKERVSLNMSGEDIVALINGLEQSLSMGSYFPRPKTFDTYDTTNQMKSFFYWWVSTLEKKKTKLKVGVWIDYPNGEMEELQDFIKTHKAEMPDMDDETALKMLHPELYPKYRKYVKGYKQAKYYQKKKYGVVGWYEWNQENYGCKWDMAIEYWRCEKETDDTLCLYLGMETPWSPAYKFIEKINAFDGITVYAHASGDLNEPFFYWFNGRTGEEDDMKPEDNERYEQRKNEIDAIKEQKMAEAGSLRVSVIPELFLVGEKRIPQCVPSEYEWIRVEGDEALVGISNEAKHKFGEIVSVNLVPTSGKVVTQGEVFGTVKTEKTVYDLYMPATGEVLALNVELQEHPELVNTDMYDAGWMIRIRLSDPSEIDKLLAAEQARKDVEREWQTAMIDLDCEMLDEKWQQFQKEMNEELGLI